MMLLEIRDLQVYYGNIQALNGVSLEVDEGEIVCVIGANGAGKSTTLRTISRLVPARAGSRSEDSSSTIAARSPSSHTNPATIHPANDPADSRPTAAWGRDRRARPPPAPLSSSWPVPPHR